MIALLTIIHIVVSLCLIAIVLLQHGKGADIGATFGGSSQTVFGTEGPLPLLNKVTTGAAIIFMLTSVSLAYFSARGTGSVVEGVRPPAPVQQNQAIPEQGPVTVPLPQEQGDKTAPQPFPLQEGNGAPTNQPAQKENTTAQ